MEAGQRPSPPSVSPDGAPPRVQVIFDVTEATEMADLIARAPPAPRRPRPARGVAGALVGALVGGAAWLVAMRTFHAELLAAALGVALLAAIGAVALGGRGRASQVAAAVFALAVVLALRITWQRLAVADEQTRLAAFAAAPEFVRARRARLAERLRPAAVARRLGDGLGLAAVALVLVVAWGLPRRPR
jgi:hypothetical protein